MMIIRRGSTPTITANIPEDIDLSEVVNCWLYFNQCNKVVVDKLITDIDIDVQNHTITTSLSQEDTLRLKVGTCLIQIRLLLADDTCLPSSEAPVRVLDVYKEGVMSVEPE